MPIYYSEYDHALDPQCRITLPSCWRSDSAMVLLPTVGKALILFPEDVLMEVFNKVKQLSIANPKLQKVFAALGSQARPCKCDKQGRMALDRNKLDQIGVKNQVKLIGALAHIRIVAPETWQEPSPDELLDCLSEINGLIESENPLATLLGAIAEK